MPRRVRRVVATMTTLMTRDVAAAVAVEARDAAAAAAAVAVVRVRRVDAAAVARAAALPPPPKMMVVLLSAVVDAAAAAVAEGMDAAAAAAAPRRARVRARPRRRRPRHAAAVVDPVVVVARVWRAVSPIASAAVERKVITTATSHRRSSPTFAFTKAFHFRLSNDEGIRMCVCVTPCSLPAREPQKDVCNATIYNIYMNSKNSDLAQRIASLSFFFFHHFFLLFRGSGKQYGDDFPIPIQIETVKRNHTEQSDVGPRQASVAQLFHHDWQPYNATQGKYHSKQCKMNWFPRQFGPMHKGGTEFAHGSFGIHPQLLQQRTAIIGTTQGQTDSGMKRVLNIHPIHAIEQIHHKISDRP